jgi:hypothetical protein
MGYRTALANIGYIYEHGIEDEKMQVPVHLSRAMPLGVMYQVSFGYVLGLF